MSKPTRVICWHCGAARSVDIDIADLETVADVVHTAKRVGMEVRDDPEHDRVLVFCDARCDRANRTDKTKGYHVVSRTSARALSDRKGDIISSIYRLTQ